MSAVRLPARLRGPGRDRGTVSIEFLGFLPILLVVGLAVVQLGLAAFAIQQAGTGARAAARTASMDESDHPPAPEAALPGRDDRLGRPRRAGLGGRRRG